MAIDWLRELGLTDYIIIIMDQPIWFFWTIDDRWHIKAGFTSSASVSNFRNKILAALLVVPVKVNNYGPINNKYHSIWGYILKHIPSKLIPLRCMHTHCTNQFEHGHRHTTFTAFANWPLMIIFFESAISQIVKAANLHKFYAHISVIKTT